MPAAFSSDKAENPRKFSREARKEPKSFRASGYIPHPVRRAAWISLLVASIGLSCTKRQGASEAEASSTAPQTPAEGLLPQEEERLAELVEIEAEGDADAVSIEDIGHHQPLIRRAAARALARSATIDSYPKLQGALADEDPEAIAWAAHGLGRLCDAGADKEEVTGALAIRSLSLPRSPSPRLDPAFAITQALANCATEEAKQTLALWLDRPAPFDRYAALGLGHLASRNEKLPEDAASTLLQILRADPPRVEALFALGYLDKLSPSSLEQLLEASRPLLEAKSPHRLHAIRALAKAGAAGDLESIVKEASAFDASERIEAIRGLSRLGDRGEKALAQALVDLLPTEPSLSALGTDAFGPLLTLVERLRASHPSSRQALKKIANLSAPEDASAPLSRRLGRLRCVAARKLEQKGAPCDAPPEIPAFDPKAKGEGETGSELGQGALKLTFVTDAGSASIHLDPSLAPASVARFVELARQGAYDGVPIRRVVHGSFLQIGPARANEPRPPLPLETSPLPFEALSVGVALDDDGEAGSDQLFITLARLPELDGAYSWIGRAEPTFAKLIEGDIIERALVSN